MLVIRLTLLYCLIIIPLSALEIISMYAEIPWNNHEGYTPIVLHVDSRQACTLEVTITEYSGKSFAVDTFNIPASQTYHRTILLPGSVDNWGLKAQWRSSLGINGEIDIDMQHETRSLQCLLIETDNSLDIPTIYQEIEQHSQRKEQHSSSSSGTNGENLTASLGAADLPDRWQAYPFWTCILLTPQANRKITNLQRIALKQWQMAGGHLLMSDLSLQTDWPQTPVVSTQAGYAAFHEALIETDRGNLHKWRRHPVPDTGKIPVLGFGLLVVLFMLTAGPLNLWWARKRKQLGLVLIITPLLSGITCIAIIATAILSEGVHIKRSVAQLVELHPTSHQTITWDAISYFAPLAPSGFEIDPTSRLLILDDETYEEQYYHRYDSDRGNTKLIWDTGCTAVGNWIPNRLNRQLEYMAIKPERQRIEIIQDGQGWLLSNGLSQEILALNFKDASGNPWSITNIAPGNTAPLQQHHVTFTNFPTGRFSVPASTTWNTHVSQQLSYTAITAAPFTDIPGPESTDTEEAITFVCGSIAMEVGP